MIEIELRYKIETEPDMSTFTLINEKAQRDVYYDVSQNGFEYALFQTRNFIRVRNGRSIDFKLDIGDDGHNFCKETNFDIESINDKNQGFLDVFNAVGISIEKGFNSFDEFIAVNKFFIFCPIDKKRKTYNEKDGVTVMLDDVKDLGMFVEVEVDLDDSDVSNKDEIVKGMEAFLRTNKLITENDERQGVGYVEMYLKRYNPSAYELGFFKN